MHQFWKELIKGFTTEIPPFRLALGLCPVLAVTKSASNGLGMGLAVVFVLALSNVLISLMRNFIPKKVRIAAFITVSATLVVAVELLMQAYAYPLYLQLGIFVSLIVVNCIILGRAEGFASKNPVHLALADGIGIGLGFTLSLTLIGTIREVLGAGTWFGVPVMWEGFQPFAVMAEAPGAFLCLGLILALMNYVTHLRIMKDNKLAVEAEANPCGSCQGCAAGRKDA